MLEWDLSALFHDKEALLYTRSNPTKFKFQKTMKINFIH